MYNINHIEHLIRAKVQTVAVKLCELKKDRQIINFRINMINKKPFIIYNKP
jgi:hypothetical protein